jgi:hypothetical protein
MGANYEIPEGNVLMSKQETTFAGIERWGEI